MAPLFANIVVSAILLGANNGDPGGNRYDYSLPITNDTSTPLDAIHLDIDDAQPDEASSLENWRFDAVSGVDYWSSVVASDLQPTESTVLKFTAGWLTSFGYSALFFDPVTFDEFEVDGTVAVVPLPEPASFALLSSGFFWILIGKKSRNVGR